MSKTHNRQIYPFSAIVGQDIMKTALILNAINPSIGGVLIKGERGTAKSTAVRSLAALLPENKVVMGCTFGCDPEKPEDFCEECRKNMINLRTTERKMTVVELPVSATEDMVVGSLDISSAIKEGEKKFEPGILAAAHRNILYVDEVNLLNDHIVDLLLDVAAMGLNIIEREGVSYTHPSSFILVGTMNPEEGDLRPQLLDRFGLCAVIEGISDAETRLEIIKRRMEFENDPTGFAAKWAAADKKIADKILAAKALLPDVVIPDDMLRIAVQICTDAGVDGHRGDITLVKTAVTLCAYKLRTEVTEDDIKEAAKLVLAHRMRKTPFSNEQYDDRKIDESIEKAKNHGKSEPKENDSDTPQKNTQNEPQDNGGEQKQSGGSGSDNSETKFFKASDPFA